MENHGLPLGATMDLQYRLPPPQQVLMNPTIFISLVLLGGAILTVMYLAHRGRAKAKREARDEAIRMAKKILLKRGGTGEDVDRLLYIFSSHSSLDPASLVMVKEKYRDILRPLFEKNFGIDFSDRMEKIFFPPPKDTRYALRNQSRDVKAMVEEQKATGSAQAAAIILDLMDATLKPGAICRLTFEDIEGGFECLVMGHDMHSINVTLPAHNDKLVGALRSGMSVEGTLESGPSLMAFTSAVIQAVAGSMPYCRIAPWKTAWEIRKRDSVRLPISLEVDFQHISTSGDNIKMSNLQKEIGTIRPGRLIDLSLGGCCVETPIATPFQVGDMIRFSKSLVTGNPPATLLGAVVNIDVLDPKDNEGAAQRLHIQFLVIDDVSQRILVRTLRQLQDVAERDEWMQAQQLMQRMRRNRIQNIGSPSAAAIRRDTTDQYAANKTTAKGVAKTTGNPTTPAMRPTTRSLPKVPPAATRMTGRHSAPASSSRRVPGNTGTGNGGAKTSQSSVRLPGNTRKPGT